MLYDLMAFMKELILSKNYKYSALNYDLEFTNNIVLNFLSFKLNNGTRRRRQHQIHTHANQAHLRDVTNAEQNQRFLESSTSYLVLLYMNSVHARNDKNNKIYNKRRGFILGRKLSATK